MMRVLTLMMILALSAQPLQAGYCPMDHSQNGPNSASHAMDGDMDAHDCCDTEPSGSDDGCQDGMHCRLCTTGVLLLPNSLRVDAAGWPAAQPLAFSDTGPLPSHASPPYRPPIS